MNKKLSKWNINPGNKIISLDKKSFYEKVIGFFGFPKYKLIDFYRYIMSRFDDEDLMPFPEPIKKDGEEGSFTHPPRFVLSNNWIIKKNDLKHLIKGPLITEDKDNILVSKNSLWKTFLEIGKGILCIMGSIMTIYGFYNLILLVIK